jgi:hypothetical protein
MLGSLNSNNKINGKLKETNYQSFINGFINKFESSFGKKLNNTKNVLIQSDGTAALNNLVNPSTQ